MRKIDAYMTFDGKLFTTKTAAADYEIEFMDYDLMLTDESGFPMYDIMDENADFEKCFNFCKYVHPKTKAGVKALRHIIWYNATFEVDQWYKWESPVDLYGRSKLVACDAPRIDAFVTEDVEI